MSVCYSFMLWVNNINEWSGLDGNFIVLELFLVSRVFNIQFYTTASRQQYAPGIAFPATI